MRVLVDTSVWVDFFNRHPSPEAEALKRLIIDEVEILTCGVVAAELLQGIRRAGSISQLEKHFCDMGWLTPEEPETYLRAASLYRRLRSSGITIRSTIDCLIALLAEQNGALLLFKDRDLRNIVESGYLGVRALPIP